MSNSHFDVTVIGGGPAGHAAAMRCALHGLRVALVEQGEVGGTCLNVGCIPSKAVIHAAEVLHASGDAATLGLLGIESGPAKVDFAKTSQWVSGLVHQLRSGLEGEISRSSVELVRGRAEIIEPRTVRVDLADETVSISSDALVIATGSRAMELHGLPFGANVVDSTGLLQRTAVPSRLAVIGGGYIGLELGTAFSKLGAEVTVVEQAEAVLPSFDRQLARPVQRRLDELGIVVHTGSTADGFADGALTTRDTDGGHHVLDVDVVLVAVGRRPATTGFGLERLGVELRPDGAIAIDERGMSTVRGVYAVGDVTGEPMLAHRGIAQGILVGDVLAGQEREWDHRALPAVCFTDPEICSVGKNPHDLPPRSDGRRPLVGQAPFRANGRALALGSPDGAFVRVVATWDDGEIVGMQAVGPGASELAAVGAALIEQGATLGDAAATIIAHPTLAEVLLDAVDAAWRRREDSGDATPSTRG